MFGKYKTCQKITQHSAENDQRNLTVHKSPRTCQSLSAHRKSLSISHIVQASFLTSTSSSSSPIICLILHQPKIYLSFSHDSQIHRKTYHGLRANLIISGARKMQCRCVMQASFRASAIPITVITTLVRAPKLDAHEFLGVFLLCVCSSFSDGKCVRAGCGILAQHQISDFGTLDKYRNLHIGI